MAAPSILDDHREQIEAWLADGVPKTNIAKKLSVNPSSIHNWINTRLKPSREPAPEINPLLAYADQATEAITARVKDEIYFTCAYTMEGLERKGLWLGNGHHAAQNMQAEIMLTLTPLLKAVIHKMVLR